MSLTNTAFSTCRLPVLLTCAICFTTAALSPWPEANEAIGADLFAGAAKVDITNDDAGPAHGRMFARALVLKHGDATVAVVGVDAVAIGEIGYISNDYLPNVRAKVAERLKIPAKNIVINASHCHGIVCKDVEARTVKAIEQAAANLTPVRAGSGVGHEDRISENRRLKLKDGRTIDVRHAYSMPADEDVAEIGPIDPEIGVLRLDRKDNGLPLAILYHFSCHPIQGVAGKQNTADITGFSSAVIEENLGDGSAIALFVQGCGGDINPVYYKDVEHPRDAEPLGNQLGLSTLRAARKISCSENSKLAFSNETLSLPRADLAQRIAEMETERERLLESLRGTSLNLKTFLPLVVKHGLAPDFPSYYSHAYLQQESLGRGDLRKLDSENRGNMKRYIQNIQTMEQLTRLQTNLRLLRRHQAESLEAGERTLDVEVAALRVGDFRWITFPGELTVQIGLNIKKQSPHEHTFVSGYTNGYIYYTPTDEQLRNAGNAQEDSDCLVAPGWQAKFEGKALSLLERL